MIEKKLDPKKDFIAKVAIDVFFANGYKESSLQDIASKAKLSKAGIYHYFKSKSDLLFYILLKQTNHGLQILEDCLAMAVREQLTPLLSFEKLIRLYIEEMLDKHKIALLILRERHQIVAANKRLLTEKERAIFRLLRNRLEQVPNRKANINLNLMSFQIMSMIHWMGYWYDPKGSLSKREVIDQTVSIIFSGILK